MNSNLYHHNKEYYGAGNIFISISLAVCFFLLPLSAIAATLFLTPKAGTYYKGENFNVSVLVSSDTSVNAFSGVITFPTDTLEVTGVSKSNSIVDRWTQNPSFSNGGSIGNVSFEGVVLNPGFVGPNGKILTLTFRVKKEGSTNLNFSEYAVLENNGLGTKAVTNAQGASFTLSPPRAGTSSKASESGTLPTVREIVLVKEIEVNRGIINAWNFLPDWVKISVLALVGLTAVLLSLLIISFGVITLIWLWGHLRERENEMTRWLIISKTFVKNFFRAIPVLLGLAGKEVRGDVGYGFRQLRENVIEAKDHIPLSKVLDNFWASIKRIIKRFFTKNEKTTKKTTDEETEK